MPGTQPHHHHELPGPGLTTSAYMESEPSRAAEPRGNDGNSDKGANSNVLEITRALESSVDKLSGQLDTLSKDLEARFDKIGTLLK